MDEKRELFENMPVSKAVAKMAIPTVISQLINLIYSVVDTFFIGRTGDPYELAGVTVSFSLFMMTIAFSNLFGIGGGSLIARLIGRRCPENAKKVSAFAIYASVCASALYALLIGVFMNPLLRLLGATDATIEYARQYTYLVVVAGSVPTIVGATLAHILRNTGLSKQASLGLSGGGILNIALDPLFMFVLLPKGYEVAGAALATLISNVLSCVYLLLVFRKQSHTESVIGMRLSDAMHIAKPDTRELFSVGVPSAILPGLFDIACIVLNSLMAKHGALQLAAIGIVIKAERLPNAINIGICQGMMPIVAYNYSAKNYERMRKTVRLVRIYGLMIALASVALFMACASPIVRIFLSTTAGNVEDAATTVGFAVAYLRLRCLASPVQFLNYHTSYCMQAMGDGKGTLLHAVIRELALYIPIMFLLDSLFGATGLASGLVVGEALSAVVALLLMGAFLRRKNIGRM